MRANLQHMALLSVRGIKKHFGGVIVLDGVDMDLERGKVYQLIGSNGSGKTTLVDIISGRIHSDEGNVILDGNDITQSGQLETYRAGLVRTFQIPRPFRKLATIENMSVSATGNPGETFVKASIYRLWRKRERQVYEKASSITKWIGLGSRANEESQNLSGGQQKLLETGRVMMVDPKIVLLDEPIAGVNPSLAHHIFKKIREVAEKTILNVEILCNCIDSLTAYAAIERFSRTVRFAKTLFICGRYAMPMRDILCGGFEVMSFPKYSTEPSCIVHRPNMLFRSVLFPPPFGPTITVIPFLIASKSTPNSILLCPYPDFIFFTLIAYSSILFTKV